MNIPKHLQQPGMNPLRKIRVRAFVAERRKLMRKAPTFGTVKEATDKAVEMAKKDEASLPSVWKEPQDVGQKHAVVHTDYVEDAYNAGYTEVVSKQKIFDLANGRDADDIEEVE